MTGNHLTVDFYYQNEHDMCDKEVYTVEATFWVNEPDINCKDSDWDYLGACILDAVDVFLNGKKIYGIPVPTTRCYKELKDYIDFYGIEQDLDF